MLLAEQTLLTLLCAVVPAVHADDEPGAAYFVSAECQMVIVPQKAALALLPELNDDTKIEAAFVKLQAMIEKGEAQLVANLLLKTREGEQANGETIEEFRYPQSFEPPNLPNPLPKENAVEILKAWPVVVNPNQIETRNVGAVFEFKPQVRDNGQSIEFSMQSQHVRFLRFAKINVGVLGTGDRLAVETPQFHAMRNTGTLRVRNGQRVLIGVHKVPEEDGMIELFLLRCSATKGE